MRYAGWNFEKTLLIREPANIERKAELIDVRLAVVGERASNITRDARVILKKDWNVLDREIPCQVYGIQQHGETTTFRVAFHVDLGAGQSRRVGIYYDNPDADAPAYETDLDVQGSGLGYTIETPFYAVATDARSGQLETIAAKIGRNGHADLRPLHPPGRTQEGNTVIFAMNGPDGCRAVPVSASDRDHPQIVEETTGPIFFKQTRKGRLVPPGYDVGRDWPELEITYKFFARQPYVLVYSRLTFPEDTGVFGVYNDILSVSREQFSHYTFRPVSPDLPLTDVEEMGHIVVDPAWTADLPVGVAFSGFLPLDLAWHAFINTRRLTAHAVSGIQLLSAMHSPGGEPVTYRPATYLVREEAFLQWFRAPIYVQARNRKENVVRVPAGTVLEELNALYVSGWNEDWGQEVDGLGRRLNNPVEVSVHPLYLGGPVPPEAFEPLPRGRRANAYLRAGVR